VKCRKGFPLSKLRACWALISKPCAVKKKSAANVSCELKKVTSKNTGFDQVHLTSAPGRRMRENLSTRNRRQKDLDSLVQPGWQRTFWFMCRKPPEPKSRLSARPPGIFLSSTIRPSSFIISNWIRRHLKIPPAILNEFAGNSNGIAGLTISPSTSLP